MSSLDNNPAAPREDQPGEPPSTPESAETAGDKAPETDSNRLAHELANLLDGSLRNLGLVIAGLRRTTDGPGGEPATHAQSGGGLATVPVDDNLLVKLGAANQAMQQMAMLIHRWKASARPPRNLYTHTWSLGDSVEHAVRLLSPEASERDIELVTYLAQDAAALPAGPLLSVIINGLRNAIESIDSAVAINGASDQPHRIELSAGIDAGTVTLAVMDSGSGINPSMLDDRSVLRFGATTKSDGHGLGLILGREVAETLGGELQLTNRSARGAVLTLRFPLQGLVNYVSPS